MRPPLAGPVLLFLLLFLVLFSWRLAAISFVTILLSLFTAIYVLYLLRVPFNVMVLAGLAVALGVVIDDALVHLGAIRSSLREQRASGARRRRPPWWPRPRASCERRSCTQLIVMLAPLPLFFLGDVAGSFSRPAILAYTLAVLSSTLVALTLYAQTC